MVDTETTNINPFARDAHLQGLFRWLPGLKLLGLYEKDWLLMDILAGLVLMTALVPVGMGYAEAAGLPAICGLYATMIALLAYAIFGQSRILVLGPDSALVAMIAATILPLAARGSGKAVALAGVLAILSGLLCVLAGVWKFGFITDLISKPIRCGYLNAIALTLIGGQFAIMCCVPVSGLDLMHVTNDIANGILSKQINWTALSIGLACLAVILACKRYAPKVPGVLIAVVAATLAVSFFDLAAKTGVSVVGSLTPGLPQFRLPDVSLADAEALVSAAIAIALVSFADMSVVSRTFALRGGYRVDDNQELIALGAANIACGFFQGFSVTSSASRTPLALAAGGKTQVTGLIGALSIATLLIFVPALLKNVPTAMLAAVVISVCLALLDVSGMVRLYKVRPLEFVSALACFLGVAMVGVIQGIFIAIGLALSSFIWRAWRPHQAVLGRVDGVKGYHDITRHAEAKLIPGLVLFRWDAPLFFANAGVFHESILQAVAEAQTKVRRVVVEAEPVTDIDTTAADALSAVEEDLHAAGIELCFAQMKGPVKDELKQYGLFDKIGAENFFPTMGQAVGHYLTAYGIDRQEWEHPNNQPSGG